MCIGLAQHWRALLILCLVVASTGCRNRVPFSTSNQSFPGLSGPTTIASPQTYSLQIPGNPNPNYYNGSGTTGQLPAQHANNTLQVPNGSNSRAGWQAAGTANQSNAVVPLTTPPTGSTSVLENRNSTMVNQTQVVSVTPPSRIQNNNRVAGNTNPTTGLSFTDATNFLTTAVDERLDQSRLPVTDASQVRAPTSFSSTTRVGQFAAPYYVPGQQNQQNVFPQRQQIVNPNYGYNRPNVIVGNFGQPNFSQPAPQVYSRQATQNRQVLAQSTVYADPANDPNFQNGWRDRDLTASRSSFNR